MKKSFFTDSVSTILQLVVVLDYRAQDDDNRSLPSLLTHIVVE